MKNILLKSFVFILFISFVGAPLAASANEQEKSIDDVLTLIRQEQGVTANAAINPDKVSTGLLEQLGDAVVASRHPNEREHEWMDQMMGGEDSPNLKAMERIMGYRYLQGVSGNGGYFDGPGYFGRGMMNGAWGMPMMGGSWNGLFGRGWGFNMGGVLFWLIGIGFIGTVITLIVVVLRRQKVQAAPIDLLKARFARGEINKEEYEKIRHCARNSKRER